MCVCTSIWICICITGWSKETVNYNFSLTDLKDTKYGITQYFLESWYSLVLIFGCLKWVRQKNPAFQCCAKMVGLAPAWLDPVGTEPTNTPSAPPWPAQTSQNITQIHQNTPPDTSRQHQTPTDTDRQRQTSSNIHDNPQTILEHSWGTPKTLLNIPWSPQSL